MEQKRVSNRRVIPDHHDLRALLCRRTVIFFLLCLTGVQRIKIDPAFPSGANLPALAQEQVRVKSWI
jgi:hypothetical protein